MKQSKQNSRVYVIQTYYKNGNSRTIEYTNKPDAIAAFDRIHIVIGDQKYAFSILFCRDRYYAYDGRPYNHDGPEIARKSSLPTI